MTVRLISQARALAGRPLPANDLKTAKDCLLDWLAIVIAGSKEPLVQIPWAEVDEQGSRGICTVVGRKKRALVLSAAMVNAAAADALDFSDGNLAMRGHTTPAVVATALAFAEESGSSVIAGIETDCRIGLMVICAKAFIQRAAINSNAGVSELSFGRPRHNAPFGLIVDLSHRRPSKESAINCSIIRQVCRAAGSLYFAMPGMFSSGSQKECTTCPKMCICHFAFASSISISKASR
ncbi:MAG: MmgE/PrpD family protein [Xanthobacteraceae bacterium]